MPRTVEVYKFEELSESAKSTAIEKHRNKREYFMDSFNEGCEERIKEAGFEGAELSYSLGYCQGDGLSFKAKKYNKLEDLFKEVLGTGKDKTAKLLAENCTQVFTGNTGHYCYAHKSQIDLYLENYTSTFQCSDRIDEVVGKVREKLKDIYVDFCKQLENDGYKDMEEQMEDENIADELIANEYEFNEDGSRY